MAEHDGRGQCQFDRVAHHGHGAHRALKGVHHHGEGTGGRCGRAQRFAVGQDELGAGAVGGGTHEGGGGDVGCDSGAGAASVDKWGRCAVQRPHPIVNCGEILTQNVQVAADLVCCRIEVQIGVCAITVHLNRKYQRCGQCAVFIVASQIVHIDQVIRAKVPKRQIEVARGHVIDFFDVLRWCSEHVRRHQRHFQRRQIQRGCFTRLAPRPTFNVFPYQTVDQRAVCLHDPGQAGY